MAKKTTKKPYIEVEGVRIHPSLKNMLRPVADLVIDPKNSRNHGDRSLRTIADSFERFGMQKPIMVRAGTGVCIAGSGRLAAAVKLLGWTHVAVMEWTGSEADARAFAVMDNRSAELSTWDYDNLAGDLQFAGDDDMLSFGDMGFTDEEAGTLIADIGFEGNPDAEMPSSAEKPKAHPHLKVVFIDPDKREEVEKALREALASFGHSVEFK